MAIRSLTAFSTLAGRTFHQLLARVEHLVDFQRDDGNQKIALVLIVVVERAGRELGPGGDGFDLCAFVTDFAEELAGNRQQAPFPFRFLFFPQACHDRS